MTKAEELNLRATIRSLEARLLRLEGLLKAGSQIGETEHGDIVYAKSPKPDGIVSRMAEALLGTKVKGDAT